jgi:hypothetical protein
MRANDFDDTEERSLFLSIGEQWAERASPPTPEPTFPIVPRGVAEHQGENLGGAS